MHRVLRRLAVVPSVLLTPLIAPADASAVGIPRMRVTVFHTLNGFLACGSGESTSLTHRWMLAVEGVRSTTGVFWENYTDFGPTFDECLSVSKQGSPAGGFVVTLSYVGAGPDVTGTFVGGGEWSPFKEDGAFDSGSG